MGILHTHIYTICMRRKQCVLPLHRLCTAVWRWICCCRGSLRARTDTPPAGETPCHQTWSQTRLLRPNIRLWRNKRTRCLESFTPVPCVLREGSPTCAVILGAVPHSPHAHAGKVKCSELAACHMCNTKKHKFLLTKCCSPVEALVLVHKTFHGKHRDTERQGYMSHSVR